LKFHIQGIETFDATWTKLEVIVFGKHMKIQAQQLKNQWLSFKNIILVALKISIQS
jgi:hypothetical protein